MRRYLTLFLLTLSASAAVAQTADDMKRLDALDRACEAARESKLRPIRAQMAERCVREGKGSQETCAAQFADYGNTRKTVNGSVAGLYYDLPPCKAAFEARGEYRR